MEIEGKMPTSREEACRSKKCFLWLWARAVVVVVAMVVVAMVVVAVVVVASKT